MDLYSLDPETFKIQAAIDGYSTLIWTERYSDAGDVTLVVPSNLENRQKYFEGMFLWTPESLDVVLIDTVLDQEGKLLITGKFLAGFLTERILRDTWTTTATSWKLTGTPGNIVATIVQQMCVAGGLITGTVLPSTNGSNEPIPNLTVTDATTSGSSTTIAVDYGNVFDGVKQICDAEGLGFRMYPPDLQAGIPAVEFLVYEGRDLTSGQSVNPVVIFDPALDSLSSTSELRSIAGYKTAAFAWAANMTTRGSIGVAFVNGTDSITGFARRTLLVDASDIDASQYTSTELTSILNRRAKNALVNNNYVRTTDGTVVPNNQFVYGLDYKLGDIVELRGNSDLATSARVTEYIRSKDNTGETAYPTLSVL